MLLPPHHSVRQGRALTYYSLCLQSRVALTTLSSHSSFLYTTALLCAAQYKHSSVRPPTVFLNRVSLFLFKSPFSFHINAFIHSSAFCSNEITINASVFLHVFPACSCWTSFPQMLLDVGHFDPVFSFTPPCFSLRRSIIFLISSRYNPTNPVPQSGSAKKNALCPSKYWFSTLGKLFSVLFPHTSNHQPSHTVCPCEAKHTHLKQGTFYPVKSVSPAIVQPQLIKRLLVV